MLHTQYMIKEAQIINALKSGEFELTVHADEQMDARDVVFQDIVHVGWNYSSIWWQDDKETWAVEGPDGKDRNLTVIVALEDDGTLIVSVIFYGEGP